MKSGLLKKLFALAIVGASFVAASAHAEDLLDQVKARGTLRVGLEGTFPPFNSKAPNGELVGYDVDIARAVAAKMGLKPEFVTTECFARAFTEDIGQDESKQNYIHVFANERAAWR